MAGEKRAVRRGARPIHRMRRPSAFFFLRDEMRDWDGRTDADGRGGRRTGQSRKEKKGRRGRGLKLAAAAAAEEWIERATLCSHHHICETHQIGHGEE